MSLVGNENRYGVVAQAFHWVTAILVGLAWLTAGHDGRPLHESLGFAVFVVVAARLVWRLFDRRPAHRLSAVSSAASKIVHALLYVLLFAIPLTAIVGATIAGMHLTIFGIEIAPTLAASRTLGRQILRYHALLGDLIVWLAGAHALAALWHHYFRHDGVLRAMLPGASA